MSGKVRVAVVGAGGIANGIHLPVLKRLESADVSHVCDLSSYKAKVASERFGIPNTYGSHAAMLESNPEIDAVFVLTQPDALFRVASDCMTRGLPVFMEKPMGVTAYQARTLASIARENNVLLHVGYNRRYVPLVVEVERRMRELTTVTQVEGRFYKNSSPAFYGGCASAFTCDVIHCVDLVRHIAGASTVQSCATLESANNSGLIESWHSVMRFDNNVGGVVRSHYSTGGRVHEFELHGAGASAYINLGFGGEACDARILCAKTAGRQSMSAMGKGEVEVITLDGKVIAGSDRYEDYYGYRDEDMLFMNAVADGMGYDEARTMEDLASAELVERLEGNKVGGR